jgi:hypothetical protein
MSVPHSTLLGPVGVVNVVKVARCMVAASTTPSTQDPALDCVVATKDPSGLHGPNEEMLSLERSITDFPSGATMTLGPCES